MLEKLFLNLESFEKRRFLPHIYTLFLITISKTLFRTNDITVAKHYFSKMLGITSTSFIDEPFLYNLKNSAILLAVGLLLCFPLFPSIRKKIEGTILGTVIYYTLLFLLFMTSIGYLAANAYNPFIYFNF